jgi:general secretion pathway protein G
MTENNYKTLRSGGFTFLEVLAVVIIISILATIVAVKVGQEPARAKVAAAKTQIEMLANAIEHYSMKHGGPPTQEQGLSALCRRPAVEPVPENYPPGGYIRSTKVPEDPWGNEYAYLVPGPEGHPFEIISYGADGEPGGEGLNADLSNLE